MMREGGQNLEERVRRLEADVEGHERELERLRLSLASSREMTAPDRIGRDPGAADAAVRRARGDVTGRFVGAGDESVL
jgi:hypothetical protein